MAPLEDDQKSACTSADRRGGEPEFIADPSAGSPPKAFPVERVRKTGCRDPVDVIGQGHKRHEVTWRADDANGFRASDQADLAYWRDQSGWDLPKNRVAEQPDVAEQVVKAFVPVTG